MVIFKTVMKINIKELKEDISKLHFEENPEALDLKAQETVFNSPIVCDLICTKSGNKFLCEVKLLTQVNLECSRCLAIFPFDLQTRFDFMLEIKKDQMELSSEEEDFSTKVLYGEDLSIDHLIEEALLLALPLKPLCSPDCKGLCPVCGTDLNTSFCNCQKKRTDPRWEKLKDFLKK